MADKYERYLMKEKMKEARHQAKLDAIRRKKELAEVEEIKARSRAREQEASAKSIAAIILWVIVIGIIHFIFNR